MLCAGMSEDELARWRCLSAETQARVLPLWGGDLSAYGDDHSRADLALCTFLLILTNGDSPRAEQLTQPVMDRYCVPATARASMAVYNTNEEIDALVRGLHKVREVFGA